MFDLKIVPQNTFQFLRQYFPKCFPSIALICFSFVVAAQTKPEAIKLETNKTIERAIKGGETHSFVFKVKAGQYARAEVEQKNIDVVVSLFSPQGKLVVEMDGKYGELWHEAVSCVAENDGEYRIEVKAYGTPEQSGNYTTKLAEKRASTSIDRKRLEAEAHLSAGRKFSAQGNTKFTEAAREYEAAARLWREVGEQEWEAIALTNLAWTYGGLFKTQQAIDAHQLAMGLFQKTKDRAGEAKAYNGLGLLYRDLGQHDKSIKFYETALSIRREIKDRRGQSGTLFNLGAVYFLLGQYEKTRNYWEQLLTINQEIKDRIGESQTLAGLGDVYLTLAQFEKARDYYERALVISRETKDRNNEGLVLMSLGAMYYKLAQYEKSGNLFDQALLISRETKDRFIESNALTNLGNIYISLAQYEKARDFLEKALIINREIKDRRSESATLLTLGNVYISLAQYEKARDYYEQSLKIFREIKDRNLEYTALLNLGSIYISLAQYEKTRDYYEQSLAISREIKDRYSECQSLLNLGSLYVTLAQFEKARGYYEQSLAISREIKNRLVESYSLSGLGEVYNKLAQYEKARDYYEQSLAIIREIKDRRGEERALINLGEVSNKSGQYEKARSYLEQSLSISREIKDRLGEGAALDTLGEVSTKLSQYEKARGYYEQALVIYREIKSKAGEGEVYSHLLNLFERLNNPKLVILYGKQAVNVFQEIRRNIKGLDKESQESFLKDKEPTYRKLADALIAETRFPEAQAVLDLLKEEEFGKIAQRSGGEPLFALPYSRAEEGAVKIVDRLSVLGRELSELKAKPKESLTTEETKRLSELEFNEIPAANKAFRQATEALSKVAPDVKNALDLKMKDNIQTVLPALGKGVVALYTVIGKTSSSEDSDNKANTETNIGWILLVTPEFRKAYPIDTRDLEQTVFKFREALRSPLYDPQPLAEKLYSMIFRQTSEKQKITLEQDLQETLGKSKDKTLMWSLDGVLRYVPMAALHDGKQYLVEKYRNTVFNTASLGTLLVEGKSNWEITGLGVSTEGTVKSTDGKTLKFAALKGSDAELNSIVKEKNRADDTDGIFPGSLKINNEFTKEALFEGARSGAPVVHISSHFWFNPAQEETSFLLLGNGGKLEMSEFQDYPNLFQNVDFLSLSACDTATGTQSTDKTESNGKEVEGFAYLAQTLGAKSVMASLWQVSDRGTKELMFRFYKIRKQQPELTKAEALRQAQSSLLYGTEKEQKIDLEERGLGLVENDAKAAEGLSKFKRDAAKPFAHPYYWSPFILIGNWR